MKTLLVLVFSLLFSISLFAQSDLQKMTDTEQAFITALSKGTKTAFLQYLTDDAMIFRPGPLKGKEFWNSQKDTPTLVIRKPAFADIAYSGQFGYTAGTWESYADGNRGSNAEYGQYVTIWEKRGDDNFRASIDIVVVNDQLSNLGQNKLGSLNQNGDPNAKGWSVTNASMDFFKTSLADKALGKAYKEFADNDIRLLRERQSPLIGKKDVVSETKSYRSVEFPKDVAVFQSLDMAYVWNPCEYADSNEGRESGNCLHIWKLRNNKWWIVLGVFARIPNRIAPTLTTAPNTGKPKKKKG